MRTVVPPVIQISAPDARDFEITIDFTAGEGDPSRVFRAMSGLIDAMKSFDAHLAEAFDSSLDATLVLEEVSAGSVRAKLRNVIIGVPDEALKDGDWKKLMGHFLLRGKYILLKWLDETPKLEHRDDIRVLEGELLSAAEETNLKQLPAYAPPRAEVLLSDIQAIQRSMAVLEEQDTACYSYDDKTIEFNRDLSVSEEIVREVLTREILKQAGTRIVKVKKPDYLGQSMWGLQFDGRAIDAKISDSDWLDRFQSRQIDVRPGDSLKVTLYEEISYGYDGEVVHRHYEVEKVHETIRPSRQGGMAF
jgi:hypothetical protein